MQLSRAVQEHRPTPLVILVGAFDFNAGVDGFEPLAPYSIQIKGFTPNLPQPIFFGNFMLTGSVKGHIVVYTTRSCNEEKLQSYGDRDDKIFQNYRDRCPGDG